MAGWKRMAVSGDTRAVGAEARVMESGMVRWSRRVTERAPGREMPSGEYRKSFDDDHGIGAFWTAETSGLGGEGSGDCGWVWPGLVIEQALTERQESSTPAIGQEPERADADKAAGQDMEQEAAQELFRTERHHSLLITVGIILPAESNLIMLESHEAVVGDGHAMGVAGEIAEHMMRTAEGRVTGNLTVSGTKSFKIDHPLDPANKYLYHASLESSEVLNFYSGNATLDAKGEATVQLPNWFEALNRDFRYQLTAIGAAAPGLHIAQEIQNHSFRIAGGAAAMKVSWQVTAVRQDAWERAHPMAVEVQKPLGERGYYINPREALAAYDTGHARVRRSTRSET